MDPPVPGSSHGSEDAPEGGSLRSGQGRPMGQPRTAEVGSLRVERPGQSLEEAEDGEDDGFDSEEFREWMRNRGRSRRPNRSRRQESSDGSDGGGGGGRTNAAGPPPDWDGESLGFQDYLIKARLWLATTKSKPRTRGPLLLSKLTKVPFETMKFLGPGKDHLPCPSRKGRTTSSLLQSMGDSIPEGGRASGAAARQIPEFLAHPGLMFV